MQELTVPLKYDNKKINTFLLDTFDNLKQNTLYKALRQRDIRINDIRISSNETIHAGDKIKVYITDKLLFVSHELNIIYEDENILAINKPAGIEVIGDNSLTTLVQNQYPTAMPCHRLDRNTYGLILFAKNETSLNILFDKFKNHEIKKYYRCRVLGVPAKKHDILKAYLFKDSSKSQVYISSTKKPGYKDILTEYTVISSDSKTNTSILEVLLHTGRTHQIRAHLSHIGYPIIGDGKYGINGINKRFGIETQQLYSYKITFDFSSEAGILEYLNHKSIKIKEET